MRILFGVQGTGNGHISRCRTLAKALAAEGANVDYILSGRDADKYFDVDAFGDYRCYKGMSFITHNGKISILQTVKDAHILQLVKDIRSQDFSSYDRIISDFEPISAWAAKLQKKPVLGISNQAIFSYLSPKEQDPVARIVMKNYAPVTTLVGLHWFHFGDSILPPMIDPIESTGENGEIIVYLPFEELDQIKELLLNFPQQTFVCFHPDIKQKSKFNNVEFHPLGREEFVGALKCCSGIITNAGFALLSEALSLGKKMLVKPLKGQFEQIYNAKCLQQMGLACAMPSLDLKTVEHWLALPSQQAVIYPDVARTLAKWIVDGEKETIAELGDRLWSQVVFPPSVLNKLNELGLTKAYQPSMS